MNKKNVFMVLIGILAVLIVFAIVSTFMAGDNNGFANSDSSSLGHDNVSISVTGDVMFGRKMPSVLGSGDPFRYVANVTSNSDILLVNFENPLTTSSNAVKGDVPLKADPSYVNLLKNACNVVVAAQANNHIFDYGEDGMKDSLKNLKSAGITTIGAGNNVDNASAPANIKVKDRTVTILNYMDADNFAEYSNIMPSATKNSAGFSAYNETLAKQEIQTAKDNGSDCVIAYMHYGNEYSKTPNEAQENMSHQLIDNGADIVIGSHTHVTQGIEVYKGKPIFYNLGNFIFDQSNSATHRAYFVNLELVNDTGEVTVYPVDLINYLPNFMSPEDGKELLNELNPQCDQMNITDEGTAKLNFKLGNSTQNS